MEIRGGRFPYSEILLKCRLEYISVVVKEISQHAKQYAKKVRETRSSGNS